MIGFTTWVSFCFFWMQSSHDHPAVLKRINRWVAHPSLIKQSKISGSICGSMWVHLLLWCLQVFNHGPMEEKYEKPEAPSTPPEASPFWPFSNLGWRALWGRPSGRGQVTGGQVAGGGPVSGYPLKMFPGNSAGVILDFHQVCAYGWLEEGANCDFPAFPIPQCPGNSSSKRKLRGTMTAMALTASATSAPSASLRVYWESTESLLRVYWESTESPLRVYWVYSRLPMNWTPQRVPKVSRVHEPNEPRP